MEPDLVALRLEPDALAPDGSQIHRLARGERTSLCQAVLPPHTTSNAIEHKSVEETWLILDGEGQIWRNGYNNGEPTDIKPGVSLVIPPQTPFQFRNTGSSALKIAIATSPPWPGDADAVAVRGHW